MQVANMTLGHLDLSNIKRVVIVRRNGGTRTMKIAADIAKFVREHHSDAIELYQDGTYCSVASTADYRSVTISVKGARSKATT